MYIKNNFIFVLTWKNIDPSPPSPAEFNSNRATEGRNQIIEPYFRIDRTSEKDESFSDNGIIHKSFIQRL